MTASTLIGVFLTLFPDSRTLGTVIIALTVFYFSVAVGRWIEYRRITRRPHIDFQIHDAFIIPATNTANCFLRVSLHNEVGAVVNNPPTDLYSLELILKGKRYARTTPIDTEKYELGIYKYVESYSDLGYRENDEARLLGGETLYRISTKAVDLVPGSRVYGWIGFAVHRLPPWDTDQEYAGTRIEYDYVGANENELEPIEESARPVDEYSYTPHTRAVESLILTVTDAFGQKWQATKAAPFGLPDRDILEKTS